MEKNCYQNSSCPSRDLGDEIMAELEKSNEEILDNLNLEEKVLLKRLLKDVRG